MPGSTTRELTMQVALSLAPGSLLAEEGEDTVLQTGLGRLVIPGLTAGLKEALKALGSGHGATEGQLAAILRGAEDDENAAVLFYHLQRFEQRGMLRHTILHDDKPLITAIPGSTDYRFEIAEISSDVDYVLSHFAYLHREERSLVLESPSSLAKFALLDERAAVLMQALATPRKFDEALARGVRLPPEATSCLGGLLYGSSVLRDPEGHRAETEDPVVAPWEFHDLLFHARSRLGRHLGPSGKTFAFLGKTPPLPAIKPVPADHMAIPLHRPDLAAVMEREPPFSRILEGRRSIREHGEPPISVEQVGEFLFRVARVRSRADASFARYETTNRPYPGGGACYELELYLVVNACVGLEPGLYGYQPERHELYRISRRTPEVEQMLIDAATSSAARPPQVLITIAARFQRVSWSYQGIAYSVVLKDVGALYQTMYLVATAMKLAPCALGRGNADLFARAAGTDYLAESSVGEFMLGTVPSGASDWRST